jgi:hypothetical protein
MFHLKTVISILYGPKLYIHTYYEFNDIHNIKDDNFNLFENSSVFYIRLFEETSLRVT